MRARMLGLAFAVVAAGLAGCGEPGPRVELAAFEYEGERHELPIRLGDELARDQSYRLRAHVELPPELRAGAVDLSIPLLQAHARVYADGELAESIEGQGEQEQHAYREAGPQRWRIAASHTADAELELELEVEHRWTQSGWLTSTPVVLAAGAADPRAQAVRNINIHGSWLAIAALIQIGLSCLLVFFLDRRRRAYLWFGIQALSASVYPAFVAGLTSALLGVWDVVLIELGLIAALTSSVYFTHSYYELGRPPRWLLAGLGAAGLLSLVLPGPYVATQLPARAVVLSVATATIYQLWTLVGMLRDVPERRVSVTLLLLAWISLACGTWADLAGWFGLSEALGGARPSGLGLTVFALCLSLLLSRSHILSLTRADALNLELEERLEQLERERVHIASLNESLRMQISDRSAQLFSALALVEGGDRRRVQLMSGTEIDGRYRTERVLGSGAMGMVYEVTRLSDDTRWALKVATGLVGEDLARLAREAHIASKIDHPNVVQIRDIDVATMGFMYIVLELVEGESLRAQVDAGALAPAEALVILIQIARGLGALHEAGIAHRDLKPDNVLIDRSGPEPSIKITDFGISRLGGSLTLDLIVAEQEQSEGPPAAEAAEAVEAAEAAEAAEALESDNSELDTVVELASDSSLGASQSSASQSLKLALTAAGRLAGTPHYVAPELALGGPTTDVRADIFSFGVLAFELLTGRRPFAIPVALSLRAKEEPCSQRVLALGPEHAALERLVAACLVFDPQARPSAAELETQLRALARDDHETPGRTGANAHAPQRGYNGA